MESSDGYVWSRFAERHIINVEHHVRFSESSTFRRDSNLYGCEIKPLPHLGLSTKVLKFKQTTKNVKKCLQNLRFEDSSSKNW